MPEAELAKPEVPIDLADTTDEYLLSGALEQIVGHLKQQYEGKRCLIRMSSGQYGMTTYEGARIISYIHESSSRSEQSGIFTSYSTGIKIHFDDGDCIFWNRYDFTVVKGSKTTLKESNEENYKDYLEISIPQLLLKQWVAL